LAVVSGFIGKLLTKIFLWLASWDCPMINLLYP
jgi:hypothetical protein